MRNLKILNKEIGKMLNKFWIGMVVVLLSVTMAGAAFADVDASVSSTSGSVTLTGYGAIGELVTVYMILSPNGAPSHDINNFDVFMSYDDTILEVDSIQDEVNETYLLDFVNENYAPGIIQFQKANPTADPTTIDQDVDIYSVTFRVLDTVAFGTSTTLSVGYNPFFPFRAKYDEFGQPTQDYTGSTYDLTLTAIGSLDNLSLASAYKGDLLENVIITTEDTIFTSYSVPELTVDLGSNITVTVNSINNDTELDVDIAINAAAAAGLRDLTIEHTVDGVVVDAEDAFTVDTPYIDSITPNNGDQGATLDVDVVATGSHFNNLNTIDFGAGITINGNGTVTDTTIDDVNISIDAGAASGSRTVTFTSSPPGGGTESLTANFTVNTVTPPDPDLVVTPTVLNFAAVEGGSNPADQSVTVENGGDGTLNWTATESETWLGSPSPDNGSLGAGASESVSFSVDISGLTVGTYNTTATFSAPGETDDIVTINLEITAAPDPTMDLSVTELNFTAVEGGSNPAAQTLDIGNAGTGTLSWSAAESETWLNTPVPDSGSLTAGLYESVEVSVDIGTLTAGNYTTDITFSAVGETDQTVTVNLEITAAPDPEMDLSTTILTFEAVEGESNPSSQNVTVSNIGTGTLNWSVADSAAWLAQVPSSGSLGASDSEDSTFSVDITGLTAGNYTDTAVFSATGETDQNVQVDLIIHPAGTELPQIDIDPTSYELEIEVGDTGSYTENVTVTNVGDGTLSWSIIESTSWLTVSPDSGSLSGNGADETVTVMLDNMEALGEGEHTATVLFMNDDVAGDIETFTVTLTVTAPVVVDPAEISLDPTELTFDANEGDETNPAAEVIILSNTGGEALDWDTSINYIIGSNWLTVDPTEDTDLAASDSQDISVAVDVSGLSEGTYTAEVTFDDQANSSDIAAQVLTVTLNVGARLIGEVTFDFDVSEPLRFTAYEGGDNPDSQTVNISNTGTADLDWEVAEEEDWLTLEPTAGALAVLASQEVTFSVDITDMTRGVYTTEATFSGGEYVEPVEVTVELTILPPKVAEIGDTIDDFEGILVTDYVVDGDGNNNPTFTRQTDEVYEGYYAGQVNYSFTSTERSDWGGYVEGTRVEAVDISHAQAVIMMLKGDGSANSVKLQLIESTMGSIDAVAEIYTSPDITLFDQSWDPVGINISSFSRDTYSPVGNGVFDGVVGGYRLYYSSTATSETDHFVDIIYVTTEAVDEDFDLTPVIESVDPPEGAVGTTITIYGTNFGDEQQLSQVWFGDGINSFMVDDVEEWSDTMIRLQVPEDLTSKSYALQVYRREYVLAIGILSNAVQFDVIAMAGILKAYPNPFDPVNQTLKMQVSVTASTNIGVYVYDLTGKLVYQTTQTLGVGTTDVTWDGRMYTGEYAGDGALLIRIVDESSKTVLSKGKVIVIKHE